MITCERSYASQCMACLFRLENWSKGRSFDFPKLLSIRNIFSPESWVVKSSNMYLAWHWIFSPVSTIWC